MFYAACRLGKFKSCLRELENINGCGAFLTGDADN